MKYLYKYIYRTCSYGIKKKKKSAIRRNSRWRSTAYIEFNKLFIFIEKTAEKDGRFVLKSAYNFAFLARATQTHDRRLEHMWKVYIRKTTNTIHMRSGLNERGWSTTQRQPKKKSKRNGV